MQYTSISVMQTLLYHPPCSIHLCSSALKQIIWTTCASHSTVVHVYIGIAMVYPHWKSYSFSLSISSWFHFNDIRVESTWKTTGIQTLVDLWCVISQRVISKLLKFFAMFFFIFFFLNQRNSITIKSMNLNLCMWNLLYYYELGNRGIKFPFVLWMRITNGQNSATMVTINLKVSLCKDIITYSNITKTYVVNPCDSCSTYVNTPLNVIHMHIIIYSHYLISFWMYVHSTYIVHIACVI